MTVETVAAYAEIVERFRAITGTQLWPSTQRCCLDVDEHGAPYCCYSLVEGAHLTFTAREQKILREFHGKQCAHPMFVKHGRVLRYRAAALTDAEHREALWTGWMADTLECASHPTRPIVGMDETVIGVVLINGCNTEIGWEHYRAHRDELTGLWQRAVWLTGIKPYYATTSIKKDWRVL